jgi:hypothetical protein
MNTTAVTSWKPPAGRRMLVLSGLLVVGVLISSSTSHAPLAGVEEAAVSVIVREVPDSGGAPEVHIPKASQR